MNRPEILVDEVVRAREEDPDFPLIQAKARARARGENYDPEKHGPFSLPAAPGTAKRFLKEADAALEVSPSAKLEEFLDKWKTKPSQLTLMEGL